MNITKGSWKTSGTGIAALLTIIGTVAKALLDNDPATNVDWATTMPGALAAIGLIFARDNNKSSEDVGATK